MRLLITLLAVLTISGCKNTYYSVWESMGVEKRDILVDRMESVNEAQEEAQQQFSSALEELTVLLNFDGGDLQNAYDEIKDQYDTSKDSAERLTSRIDKVESVAEALFEEWQEELQQYSNESLRRDSEQKLIETKRRYDNLLKAMHRSSDKMQPVLSALNDNVLYLKHNLNASAIGALQGEFDKIKRDIQVLLKDMNRAIEQSSEFIASLKSG